MRELSVNHVAHLVFVVRSSGGVVVDTRKCQTYPSSVFSNDVVALIQRVVPSIYIDDSQYADLNGRDIIANAFKPELTGPSRQYAPMLRLIVANTCNLSCPYCHVFKESQHYQTQNARLMTEGIALTSVTKFIQYLDRTDGGPFVLSFYGGESLLNQPVIQRVNQRFGTRISRYVVNTNGTAMVRRILNKLPKDHVEYHVSLDGAQQQHDQTRQYSASRGTFSLVCDNIRSMIYEGFQVQVNFMITAHNYEHLGSFIDVLVSLKIRKLYFDITREVYETISTVELAKTLIMFLARCHSEGISTTGPWKSAFQVARRFLAHRKDTVIPEIPRMNAPEMNLEVHPDGRVYSPHYCPGAALGSYQELDHIVDMPGYTKAVGCAEDLFGECRQCPLKFTCAGGIRYVWQYHYESTRGADKACEVFRLITLGAIQNHVRSSEKCTPA